MLEHIWTYLNWWSPAPQYGMMVVYRIHMVRCVRTSVLQTGQEQQNPFILQRAGLGPWAPNCCAFFWIQLDKTNTFGFSSKMRWIEFALSFLISTVSKLDASRIQSWFKGYARETHIVDDWQSHKVSKELIQWLMGYVIWHISPQKILYLKMARKMQSFPEVSSKFPFPRIFSLLQHGSV